MLFWLHCHGESSLLIPISSTKQRGIISSPCPYFPSGGDDEGSSIVESVYGPQKPHLLNDKAPLDSVVSFNSAPFSSYLFPSCKSCRIWKDIPCNRENHNAFSGICPRTNNTLHLTVINTSPTPHSHITQINNLLVIGFGVFANLKFNWNIYLAIYFLHGKGCALMKQFFQCLCLCRVPSDWTGQKATL